VNSALVVLVLAVGVIRGLVVLVIIVLKAWVPVLLPPGLKDTVVAM
jgi:hypothetical protein